MVFRVSIRASLVARRAYRVGRAHFGSGVRYLRSLSAFTVIDFTIDIAPHGKGRPRAAAEGGKARMFTPTKTRRWESTFALMAREHRPAELLTGPLRVSITAYFPRPLKMCKRSKRTGELLGGYDEGALPMASRPDADNVAKSVLDALSDWYRDDSQVWYLIVMKFHHAIGDRPRVRVTVEGVGA